MNSPITVSTLNVQIKSLLETTFSFVYVEGEISNLTYHNSGHIYFSIKDASSTISCVMFKGNTRYLKFRLEVGQKIILSGSVTVYAPRGNYQLLATKIEPSGVGALALAYEQLKKKLELKGYFDQARKKELPKYPKKIVLVTSSTGAAIEDMKKVASKRWPLIELILIPALVQGEGAKFDIAEAIQKADTLNADVMVVGRGGGSIEDLWAFNEEMVADAIFSANTPIISAVGHESDFVISDFVSDVRAATPSNAIEIALPDSNELKMYLDNLSDEYERAFKIVINNKETVLNHLSSSFKQNSFENKFNFVQNNIKDLQKNFNNFFKQILSRKEQEIKLLSSSYEANHPDKKSKKGFVQVTKENTIVSLEELHLDDIINLETSKLSVKTKVMHINYNK
ncbi:exodeoxyribonuclease VII large subunit [Arcobacter sp. 31_11_sub10_T18]|nr:exodeoxyribonuclease VII large subunit [Arcobacter sp. 31_11_sub10_T18]